MCNNHYTDSEGVTWQYRAKGLTVLERSTDGVTWSQVTNEELAELSENHMRFLESLNDCC